MEDVQVAYRLCKVWGGGGRGGANKVHYGKCGSGVWLITAPD